MDSNGGRARSIRSVVADAGFGVLEAATLESARRQLRDATVGVVLTRARLPDGEGTQLLDFVDQDDTKVILIAAEENFETAVTALRKHAFDYLTQPVDTGRLQRILKSARGTLELKQQVVDLRSELRSLGRYHRLVGASAAMQEVYDQIERVAPTTATVLVLGETGVGKELVAEAIHHTSERRPGPFVAVNCGALTRELAESELFGHVKGSFTGASRSRKGIFEQANGGTLFLDEITEMPEPLQVKLLRVLETRRVRRIGSEELTDLDIRLVAASNREPEEAVRDGKLREDLLYRLAVFPLRVPPLRDRAGDVVLLARHALEALNRDHPAPKRFREETLDALEAAPWPGNVRELLNVIHRATIMARGTWISPEVLPRKGGGETRDPGIVQGGGEYSLAEMERRHILMTLDRCDGNKKRCAEILGVSLKTLYNRLKKYRECS